MIGAFTEEILKTIKNKQEKIIRNPYYLILSYCAHIDRAEKKSGRRAGKGKGGKGREGTLIH